MAPVRVGRDDGRQPEADELIVPLPPAAAKVRRSRTGDAYRGHDLAGELAVVAVVMREAAVPTR